jgi:hypothetical protein
MAPDRGQERRRTATLLLVLAGSLMALAGLLLAILVEPAFLVLVGIGLVDLFFAALLSTGRLGAAPIASAPAGPPPEDPDHVAGEVTDDPSYNPYARED